ncbi:MAG: SEC-C domain-containing protein, partial [Candidatus Dormibacteraeota bacterium]|nr:SEC-C domain-containing protein [Candidatus Dormibacteraeota bacterium]
GSRASLPLPAQPAIRNVVESSGTGTRRADGAGTPAPNGQPRKVGRNQPCPCGSGKKYKYCHGR